MKCFLVFLSLQLLLLVKSAEITNFTQFPDIVAPGENVTFVCDAIGIVGEWRIDNMYLASSDPERGYFISLTIRENGNLHLRLTITGYASYNESTITCFVYPGDIRQHKVFIIAGPPTGLHPVISYNETGLSLVISWNEPFTHTGFNITEYAVQIVNSSNDAVRTVPMGLDRAFFDSIDTAPSECNELEYTVIAYNSVGNSTGSVRGGFPIPVEPVQIQWRVLYQNVNIPHLEIWFQPFTACTFQELSYSVHLEGVANNATYHSRDGLFYSVHEGLVVGGNYTAVVEEISKVGVTVSREDIVIQELSFPCMQEPVEVDTQDLVTTYGTQDLVTTYGAVTGILAVLSVLSLALFLMFFSLYCIVRKKGHSGGFVNPLANTIATGTNQRPNNTLQTNPEAMKVNPLYDAGPVYDSCGGQPLRGLLSNASTPGTPDTPLEETTTRYVFPPPELPPPRTTAATYCTVLDPPTLADDKKDLSASSMSENLDVEGDKMDKKEDLGSSEYTMMQPARNFKLSPLIIST